MIQNKLIREDILIFIYVKEHVKVKDQDSRSSMEDTKILEVAWNKEEVRIDATSSPSKSKR